MEALSRKAKESDVETRLVLPLLTGPDYLAIPHTSIKSKAYLTPQRIDKAAGKTKGYYPDYSIWEEALPLFIIEVKAPSVPAELGYREASLYALHLNRQYREDLNPCEYIISTNGIRLLGGFWNSNPEIDVPVEELVVSSAILEILKDRVGHQFLRQRAKELRQKVDAEHFFTAASGSLGTSLTNAKVPPNQFASALVPILSRYFASQSEDTDPAIFDAGYVPTNEQLSYDTILESLLREKAHAHKNPFSKAVQTTRSAETKGFSDRITEYTTTQRNTSQLLLVIGHVGAGKSLFIRRYRELLVPEALRQNLLWSFVNFNNFSDKTDQPEEWLSARFVDSFAAENPAIDLYSSSTTDALFSTELNRNRSVYERLASVDPASSEREKAGDIKAWLSKPKVLSVGITRHFGGEQGKVCVVVFDNVDKLDKSEQLSVFQMALSFTTEHRTLTILQLRDETFERYKDTKPLDTFKTGISFHITPPRFGLVVKRRLELAIDDLSRNAPREWEYDLENGARVRITRDQALSFLTSIFDYVFGGDVNASRILQGLAGRDVRRALDIFFKVMISGHLTNDRITSVGGGAAYFPIDENLVLRTLMREDYRFFHNGAGYVSNIFFFDRAWRGADNLLLPEILFFLASRLRTRGTIGIEGFFSVDAIYEPLQMLGYSYETVWNASQWLLARGLVEADNMSSKEIARDTAIRISSSGFIHLRVLSERLEYVSACLYEAPYLTQDMATLVRGLLEDSLRTGGLSMTRKAQGVQEFRKYIRHLKQRRDQVAPNLVGLNTALDYILAHIERAISEAIRPLNPLPSGPDVLDA